MKKAFLLIILSISLLLICNYKIYASESITLREETGFKIEGSYLTGIEEEREVSTFDLGLDTSYTSTIVNKSNTTKTSGYIFTGDKIQVKKGSTDVGEYTVLILGDTNGDGKISSLDYVKIKNHIMGTQISEEVYLKSADCNSDNKISSLDYVKVKNYIMGKSTTKYTITYNSNGGSGTMSSQSVTANTTTNLLRSKYTKNGKFIITWNTKADGSGTTYKDVSKIKVTSNITLYAIWKHTLTIQYNGNGGVWDCNKNDDYCQDENGYALKKGATYKQKVLADGELALYDYNGNYFKWAKKEGYQVIKDEEYIIAGTNIVLDQNRENKSEGKYKANDLANYVNCDLSKNDCSITIKVNWKIVVVLIGNSLTHGANDVNLHAISNTASVYEQLFNIFEGEKENEYYITRLSKTTTSLLQKANYKTTSTDSVEKWIATSLDNNIYNIAVLQEQTDTSEAISTVNYYKGIDGISSKLRNNNPNIKIYLRDAWPHIGMTSVINGVTKNNDWYTNHPEHICHNFIECQESKTKHTLEMSNEFGFKYSLNRYDIIPDGQAFENYGRTYATIPVGATDEAKNYAIYNKIGDLYKRYGKDENGNDEVQNDRTHPSCRGSYLAALCIYTQITGKDPLNVTTESYTKIDDSKRMYSCDIDKELNINGINDKSKVYNNLRTIAHNTCYTPNVHNKLRIKYNGNGGTWNQPSNQKFNVDSSGNVTENGVTYYQILNDNESLPNSGGKGLYNYNGSYINFVSDLVVPEHEEYYIDGTNVKLDQEVAYSAKQLANYVNCDLSKQNCSITLKINYPKVTNVNIINKWKNLDNKSIKVTYYPQGFAIKNEGKANEELYISSVERPHIILGTTEDWEDQNGKMTKYFTDYNEAPSAVSRIKDAIMHCLVNLKDCSSDDNNVLDKLVITTETIDGKHPKFLDKKPKELVNNARRMVISRYSLSNITNGTPSDSVFVDNAGHGQSFDYDNINNLIIANAYPQICVSDHACSSDLKNCYSASACSYGVMAGKYTVANNKATFEQKGSYNFSKYGIASVVDEKNELVGTIAGTQVSLYEYKYNEFIKENLNFGNVIKSYYLKRNCTAANQGYILYNKHIYQIKGGQGKNAYIEEFDEDGNSISIRKLIFNTTDKYGYKSVNNREVEGIKIYNNKIYVISAYIVNNVYYYAELGYIDLITQ